MSLTTRQALVLIPIGFRLQRFAGAFPAISCGLINHMCQYHRAQTPQIDVVLVRAFDRSNVHLSHSSHRIACTPTFGVRPLESIGVRVKASVRSRYPSISDNSSITCTDIYHIRRATQIDRCTSESVRRSTATPPSLTTHRSCCAQAIGFGHFKIHGEPARACDHYK
jgi:hypothetical protein